MISRNLNTWWRHDMEMLSVLLPLCGGNSPVTGRFPSQRASNVEQVLEGWVSLARVTGDGQLVTCLAVVEAVCLLMNNIYCLTQAILKDLTRSHKIRISFQDALLDIHLKSVIYVCGFNVTHSSLNSVFVVCYSSGQLSGSSSPSCLQEMVIYQ